MNFADLYRYANSLEGRNVPFDALSNFVLEGHDRVGAIQLYGCQLDAAISLGHLKYEVGVVPHKGSMLDLAQIRYDQTLNRCWTRIVCGKELMHVFDHEEAKASTGSAFLRLLKELESRPLPEHTSAMLNSENNAEWMGLLVLCPYSFRKKFENDYKSKSIDEAYIANELKVPTIAVRSIMGDYYLTALETLTGERPR